jgi:hypothetical protein
MHLSFKKLLNNESFRGSMIKKLNLKEKIMCTSLIVDQFHFTQLNYYPLINTKLDYIFSSYYIKWHNHILSPVLVFIL